MIDTATGGSALDGIDQKKPFGAYGWAGAHGDDGTLVLLVPVADQDDFLGLLGHLTITLRKGDDGVWVPRPVYFRFADGYADVTARDNSVLDTDKLLAPGGVLTTQGCIGSTNPDHKLSGSADPASRSAASHVVKKYCPNRERGILSMIVNIDRIPDEFM